MRIGIDLGGTKIEGIAIADDGSERVRRRIAAPRGDYGATLTAVVDLVHDIERACASRGSVGVGIPRDSIDGWNRYVLSLKQIAAAIPYEELVWKTGRP